MNKLELSGRLQAVAEWIPDGALVADIGTDHGYLPVFLLQCGKSDRVIAADVRIRPLEKAKACARRHGLEDKISFRICDGLSGIAPEEVDTVVLAGMGGETIASILAHAPWTAEGAHRLILQPMSKTEELRSFLWNGGFRIEAERLVKDNGSLYVLLSARGGAAPYLPGAGELYVGRDLPLNGDPLFPEYLQKQLTRLSRAISGAERSSKACDEKRLLEFSSAFRDLIKIKEGTLCLR